MNDKIPARLLLPLLLYLITTLITAFTAVWLEIESHAQPNAWQGGAVIAFISLGLCHIGLLLVQKETGGGEE